MSLKLYRRKGSDVWNYRGTVGGNRLRGSTRTADKELAAGIISEVENRHRKYHTDGPQKELKFPRAVALYLKAGKSDRFLGKIEDHWKNTKVKQMTPGAIRQSAIDIYPNANGATRNRQVITPTQAVINHAAELELCAPIRVRRFTFEKKIKQPVTLAWIDQFCAAAEPTLSALAVFLFATGCRISEARRLEWGDIDFVQRTILIRKTKAKRQRLPHMPQRLLVALANLKRDKPPFNQPVSTLRRAWERAIAASGVAHLTFHCCRHGFATSLLQDGMDVVTVAKLGGWESPHQVLSTYAHAIQDATLTNRLFDTPLTHPRSAARKINDLE
jgi:integrase